MPVPFYVRGQRDRRRRARVCRSSGDPMRTWPGKAVVLLSAWMTETVAASDVLQASR